MPRIGKNAVKFTVDGVDYIAVIRHQHAQKGEVSRRSYTTNVTLGKGKHREEFVDTTTRVRVGLVPIERPGTVKGHPTVQKLRHITTCLIRCGGVTVAEGEARCSIKDTYNHVKGIRESFINALASLGITKELERERWGKFMAAFFEERCWAESQAKALDDLADKIDETAARVAELTAPAAPEGAGV